MDSKTTKSEMGCTCCFFLEMIDGTPFCNYLERDVGLDCLCRNFVNHYRLKEILQTYNLYLSEKGVENFMQEVEGV